MSNPKRFQLIAAMRGEIDPTIYGIEWESAQGIAREALNGAVRVIETLPVGTFADEPRGTVPVRTDLIQRLHTMSQRGLGDVSHLARESAAAIERLLRAVDDLVAELRPLTEGERCDHAVGICWCPVYRALEEARDARAAAGAPVTP